MTCPASEGSVGWEGKEEDKRTPQIPQTKRNNKGVSSFPGRIGHIRATPSHSFTPDSIGGPSLEFGLHDTVFLQCWQDCESRQGQECGFKQGSVLMFTFGHPTQPKLLDISEARHNEVGRLCFRRASESSHHHTQNFYGCGFLCTAMCHGLKLTFPTGS